MPIRGDNLCIVGESVGIHVTGGCGVEITVVMRGGIVVVGCDITTVVVGISVVVVAILVRVVSCRNRRVVVVVVGVLMVV